MFRNYYKNNNNKKITKADVGIYFIDVMVLIINDLIKENNDALKFK